MASSSSHHTTHRHTHHERYQGASGRIRFAFFLNLLFALLELFGGLWTGSMAILSDALHDFGDAASLGVAWRLQRLSQRGADVRFSYGYKRFSLLGALFISIVLLVGSLFIIHKSVEKIIEPGEPNPTGMLLLSLVGLAVNGLAVYRLRQGKSLSERVVSLHMMEDLLGWGAVLIVSVVLHLVYIPLLDPLLSLAISVWILYHVYFNLRDTLTILLQGVPLGVDSEEFRARVVALEGVLSLHDFHLWTLDGESHIASLHLVLSSEFSNDLESVQTLKECVRKMAREYAIEHITLEIEPSGHLCNLSGEATEERL